MLIPWPYLPLPPAVFAKISVDYSDPFVSMTRTTLAALELYPQTDAQPELDESPPRAASASDG
jgi:hypothetical protein